IVHPMTLLRNGITENREDLVKYRAAPQFVPAGQSTQMIVGASPESDYHILTLSEKLYQNYSLKRVYFSAYTPVVEDSLLPSVDLKPPLLREHRLYQADWLLRFYGFQASEILSPERPMLYSEIDPKCGWVLRNMDDFPVEVNTADYEMLLRVPGIGVTSAKRILRERRQHSLDFEMLKRIGVVLKRARFFLICNGRAMQTLPETPEQALEWLVGPQNSSSLPDYEPEQLSLFQSSILQEEALPCLKGEL
ncbi:MAG TPA: biotin synthase, partial [Oscillospiraceae bacterium]|nr:biotin synthase [Oscillospiraceae bacterium]